MKNILGWLTVMTAMFLFWGCSGTDTIKGDLCQMASEHVAGCLDEPPLRVTECDQHEAKQVIGLSCDEVRAVVDGKEDLSVGEAGVFSYYVRYCRYSFQCGWMRCPLGGWLRQKCVQHRCVKPPVTDCPGVECASNEDCGDYTCPGGEVLPMGCSQFKCVPPPCPPPQPECENDMDCKELVCPFGGFLHERCIHGECVTPPVTDCEGVECATNEDCGDYTCPNGEVLPMGCSQFKCVPPPCTAPTPPAESACLFGC